MADTQLRALKRIGDMRQVTTERRLRLVQIELEEANRQCQSAQRLHATRMAAEQRTTADCYSNPADEQGWIARLRQAAITTEAADAVDSRTAEAKRCEAGRREAALAVLRNGVQQDVLARQVAAGRRAASLRQEEEAADEALRPVARRC